MTKDIKMGRLKIGGNYPCMIVAEISCNHLQNKELALELIEAAKTAGAGAVKFQAYTPDTMTLNPEKMQPREKKIFTISGSIWEGKTFYELYQQAYTPWEWFKDLKNKAEELGLFFFASPFDETSVDLLESMNVQAYKIASFEINHIPLLRKIAKTHKPVIFSTGVADLADIDLALKTLEENGNPPVVILKCTSAYPAPLDEVNLRTIVDITNRFNTLVGLSDHTSNLNVPAYAVALGACMVEKHFTLEKKGPDASFSLLPEEFSTMVKNIRECEKAMGKITYLHSDNVKEHLGFKRSIFVATPMKSGEEFTKRNIRIIRPGKGLHPKHYENLMGKKASRDLKMGEPLNFEMVEKSNGTDDHEPK